MSMEHYLRRPTSGKAEDGTGHERSEMNDEGAVKDGRKPPESSCGRTRDDRGDDDDDDDDVAQVRKSATDELDDSGTKGRQGRANCDGDCDGGDENEDQWEPLDKAKEEEDGGATPKVKSDDEDGSDSRRTTIIDTVPSPAALRGHWQRWERKEGAGGASSSRPSSSSSSALLLSARSNAGVDRNGGAGGGGGGLGEVRVLSAYRHPRSHKVSFGPSSSSRKKKGSSVWTPVLVLVSFFALMFLLSLTAFRDVGGDLGAATKARSEMKRKKVEMEREEEYLIKRGDVGCGLYLSKSSIAWGRTGLWGVFAARRFEKGEILFEPGISVQMGDDDEAVLTHMRVAGEISVMREGISSNINSTPPSSSSTLGDDDGGTRMRRRGGVVTVLPHLAMLVQPHPTLHNVERRHVDTSAHSGIAVVATRRIGPGEEILLDADDHDDGMDDLGGFASGAAVAGVGRGAENSSSVVISAPLAWHYRRADEIAMDAVGLAGNPHDRGRRRRGTKVEASYLKVLKRTVASYDPATASLLPETHDELMEVAKRHGVGRSDLPDGVGTSLASLSNRSLSWLDRHGRCIDNVRPGDGTVDAATTDTTTATTPSVDEGADSECLGGGFPAPRTGRPGVFATRFVPRGGLVTTSPVYVIANVRTKEGMTTAGDEGGVRRRDPWLDHCFGHDDSSAVICPSSYAVLINHDVLSPAARRECRACDDDGYSSSSGGKDCRCEDEVRSNTKYEWSAWNKDNIKHIGRPLTEGEVVQGMSLDFIATRDISPGEEIFLVTGEEWHHAKKEFSSTCCAPGETADRCRSFCRQLQMKDSVFPARWKIIL